MTFAADKQRQHAQTPGFFQRPVYSQFAKQLRQELQEAMKSIEADYPAQKRYYDSINKALVMANQLQQLFINPLAIGQIITLLDTVINEEEQPNCWQCIHPRIQKASKQLYLDGHYANAAVDAFIEINDRAKDIYKQIRSNDTDIPDGVDLMNKLFNKNNALVELSDTKIDTGANIQQGYHFMFSGAMSALRNPKAHTNTEILSAPEAMRRIMFASMLMYRLDEAQ